MHRRIFENFCQASRHFRHGSQFARFMTAARTTAAFTATATATATFTFGASGMQPVKKSNNSIDDEAAWTESQIHNQRPQSIKYHNNPPFRSDLPTYTREEIAQHYSKDSGDGRIWVTFRKGVYDMTDFLGAHPGRSGRIEMVGGQDLEPYWRVYRQHYRGHIIDFMENNYRIGNVNPSEVDNIDYDLFWNGYLHNDPPRHPLSQACTFAPYCAESPMHLWTQSFFTPNEIFYVRNHAFVPDTPEDEYELTVVVDGKEHVFSYKDLTTIFPKYEVATTVQCAANRSEDYHGKGMGSTRGMFNPPHWNGGAFSTAKWGGARIRDILHYCGVPVDEIALNEGHYPQYAHLLMTALDEDETGATYSASTFMDKVCDPHGDCLIAYEMNGRKLPYDHGYPARTIIPGHAGARQPKWIGKIEVSQTPYGVTQCLEFAPDVTFEEDLKQWPAQKVLTKKTNAGNVVQEMPVQSFICEPRQNGIIAVSPNATKLYVKGVAWSGGGVGIHRVDISGDNGKNFKAADLIKKPMEQYRRGQWAWQHFEGNIELDDVTKERLKLGEKVELEITSKAINANFNTQPATPDAQINARGVAVNHWYIIKVTLIPNESLKDIEENEKGDGKKWVDISEEFIDHITNMSIAAARAKNATSSSSKYRRSWGNSGWGGSSSSNTNNNKKSEGGRQIFEQGNRPSGGVWFDPWYWHGWTHPNGAKNGQNEDPKSWVKILDKTTEKTPQAAGVKAEIDWSYYQNLKCMNYYDQPKKSKEWLAFEKSIGKKEKRT